MAAIKWDHESINRKMQEAMQMGQAQSPLINKEQIKQQVLSAANPLNKQGNKTNG